MTQSIFTGPDGQPRPIDEATGKPAMSATEASWHEHIAAQEGARAGAGLAAAPGAAAAMMAAAGAKKVEIGGIAFHPLDIGVLWALQRSGSCFGAENPDGREMEVSLGDLALAAYVFAYPDEAFHLMEQDAGDEVRARAFALARRMRREDLTALMHHINAELGKWNAAGPTSPAAPEVPAGT